MHSEFTPQPVSETSCDSEDSRLGPGYMRVTTALPEDNVRFLEALLKEML